MSNRRRCIIKRLRLPFPFAPFLEILPDGLRIQVDSVTIIKPAEPFAELAGGERIAVADLGIDTGPAECAVLGVDTYLQGNEVILSRAGSDAVEKVAEAGAFVTDPYFQWCG